MSFYQYLHKTDLWGQAEQWEDDLDRNRLAGEHERVENLRWERKNFFGMDLIDRRQYDWQEGWLYKLEGRESKWQLCLPFHKGETKFQKTLDLISFYNDW